MNLVPFPANSKFKRQKGGAYDVLYYPLSASDKRPRASLYLRVSSQQQSEEDRHSLPEQWRLNWEAAERRGYIVVAVYIDVLSGASRQRKAFQQMLTDGRESKYQALFATMNDRLFRSMWTAADIEELVEQHNIDLFGSVEPIDKQLLGLFAWVASRERRNIVTRTMMGREAAARENRIPSGKPPFYLKVIRNAQGRPDHIEFEPYYAPVVRQLAERYAAGEPVHSIMRDLLKNVPRPSGQTKYGWTLQYLNQILKSPTLYGQWPFKQQFVEVPALIDRATWDTVQQSMGRRRTTPMSGRPARIQAPLSKLLFCKVCGQAMSTHARDWDYSYRIRADGTNARYRIQHGRVKIKYICGGMGHYADRYRCRKPEYVRNEDIFPKIWNKLYQVLSGPEVLAVGIHQVIKTQEASAALAELAAVDRQLEKIDRRLLSYSDQRADGLISPDQHRQLVERALAEQQSCEDERARLLSKARGLNEVHQQFANGDLTAQRLATRLSALTEAEKVVCLRAACRRIFLSSQNEVDLELSLPGLDALAGGLTHESGY